MAGPLRNSLKEDSSAGLEVTRQASLGTYLRQVLPVWGILVVATLAVLWVMGTSGSRLLAHLAYTSPSAWDLAMVYRADGTEGWRKCLEQVNARRPGAERLQTAVGILKGDPSLEKARQDLLRSRQYSDTFEDVPGMLADLALWDGQAAQAYAWRGDHAASAKQWHQSLADYTIAKQMGEKTAQVEEGRLESLIRLNRWDEATTMALGLQAEGVFTSRYYRLQAEILRTRGDKAGMEAAWKKALDMDPHDTQAAQEYGLFLVQERRANEAYTLVQKTTRLITNNGQLWHQHALVATLVNRPEEAIECYKKAIALQPNAFLLHHELAQLYLKLGRPNQAKPYLTRAFELNPSFFAQKKERP